MNPTDVAPIVGDWRTDAPHAADVIVG